MVDPDRCELHEAAILIGTDDSENLLRLARSPIGDECQMCPICRLAREYVGRRMAERAGRVFPKDESGEAVRLKLQSAVETVRTSVHRTA
jgi:hypothetical protein